MTGLEAHARDRSGPANLRRPTVAVNALLVDSAGGGRSGGISRYEAQLVRALADRGGWRVVAHVADPRAEAILPPPVELAIAPPWVRRPVLRILWEQSALAVATWRRRPKVFHGLAYSLPVASPGPRVVTVHDLSFFRMAWTLPRGKAAYLRAATRHAVAVADAVITISEFTASELASVLGVPGDKIHVVVPGVDDGFRKAAAAGDPDATAAFARRHGLEQPYILAVGTVQPRKNLGTLLAAHDALRRRNPKLPPLVIAGAPGWGSPGVAAPVPGAAPGAPGANGRPLPGAGPGPGAAARFLGFVADADLPHLYRGAVAFAFPSLYEGFGLPALEAMASGVPCVVAAAASLPEVVGDAGLRVTPDDPKAWAEALAAILDNPALARRLAAAGRRRAEGFTWRRAAAATTAVYRAVADPPAAEERRR